MVTTPFSLASVTGQLRRLLSGPGSVKPGLYHYRSELDGRRMRLHLRIDPDGAGLLVADAAAVLHLNATAAELAKHVLDGLGLAEAVALVREHWNARAEDVEKDYRRIEELLRHVRGTTDACPIEALDLPSVPPFGRKVLAPYRADLALSYDCDNRCGHCYVARAPGEVRTLSLEEWKEALARLWGAGIPHVCFTGGEASRSPHLLPLIERAEDLGQVSGLLTNGRRLADKDFCRSLVSAGLDHVQVTLESHDEAVHDGMVGCPGAFKETVQGIRNALEEDLYLVTNTTLCRPNIGGAEKTLEFLKELGVRTFAMNSLIYTGKAPASGLGVEETELEPALALVAAKAKALGLRFIWYTPTRYCGLNPATLGLGFKRCTAGEYNVCVEPDGTVIPCQSYYEPAGHILRDPWERIWDGPLFKGIRERAAAPEACRACHDFEVCGSGCPLSKGDRFLCSDSCSEAAV